MKIYFTASLRGKKNFQKEYQFIVRSLEELGHQIQEHILEIDPKKPEQESHEEKVKIYQKLLGLIKTSALIVAETSFSSVSVGHEISLALEFHKPVIALHLENHRPRFLEGNPDPKLQILPYNSASLKKDLKEALQIAIDQTDIRFNFFISPKTVAYLDWVAKNRKIPRSVFLRNLIKKEMENDRGFQKKTI